MDRDGDLWGVVLAGGEGARLREFTRRARGASIPKQFYRIDGSPSMLQMALSRAQRVVPASSVLTVVMESHRRWWEAETAGQPAENVLAQPMDRGTGIAILHALVEILLRDRVPLLVILPSDHGVEDERVLEEAIRRGVEIARERSNEIVMLGMPMDEPDPEYGWIVPTPPTSEPTRGVVSFEERPSAARAAQLLREGGLVNSFILCATGWALLDLFERHQREVLQAYIDGREQSGWSLAALPRLFRSLPTLDFGTEVLAQSFVRFRVLPVSPCGWTDLGAPRRLERWRTGTPLAEVG